MQSCKTQDNGTLPKRLHRLLPLSSSHSTHSKGCCGNGQLMFEMHDLVPLILM